MSQEKTLRGSCSCGRNNYLILMPLDATDNVDVYFDDSSESRESSTITLSGPLFIFSTGRSLASPLTAWLKIPLGWYQSHTTSFFPDERHNDIRRIFTPPDAPNSKRVFCGFCGTHLSSWREQPVSEADYLHVTLGSLLGEDLGALEELGLLPDEVSSDIATSEAQSQVVQRDNGSLDRSSREGRIGGVPWFEEMIEGSRLGRTEKTRRGHAKNADGTTRIEWEVSEFTDEGSGTPRAKRKYDDDRDTPMRE